jgi:parallel beta-helix repeat protein
VSGCTFGTLVGILFDSGSSGSLKQVALRNHNISDGSGGYCNESAASGIAVSSTSAASVTITGSSVRAYAGTGIQLTTTSAVTVKSNRVAPILTGSNCLVVSAPTVTVSGNAVSNCGVGIYVASTVLRTVAGNTIFGAGTSSSGTGVFCFPSCTRLTVSGNLIANTHDGMSIKTSGGVGGVTFRNNDISGTVNGVYLFIQPGNTVSHNTITDATVGVYGASGNTLSGNVYRTVTHLTQ